MYQNLPSKSTKKFAIYWLETGVFETEDGVEGQGVRLKTSEKVLDEISEKFSSIKDVKFHDLSLNNFLIFYTVGDKEIFDSWVLKDERIEKFKEGKRNARSYKIENLEGEMVCTDNKGMICKVKLDKEVVGGE